MCLFLRYWQLKFPHFLPKWTWSKQMWCHGCTMAKVCFVILYILLCCFDLELDTVASLPAGNLKSMEYSCLWLSHITSVANFKSTIWVKILKKIKTNFCQCVSMTSPPFASSSLLVRKVQTSTANISKTKHRKLTKISPECLDCIILWYIKNKFGSGLSF